MRFFYKTKGLGACGRAQPCGIEQPTMTEEAVVVEGACLLVDALFKKKQGDWVRVFESSLVE